MRETPFSRRYQRLPGSDPEADVQEELETHIASRVEDLMRQGRAESEARGQAQREFGDMAQIRREMNKLGRKRRRRERRAKGWASLGQDVRYAGRAWRRSPGFAVLTIFIMALGIGANTAVFSVVNAVLLQPLPYPGGDRIVTLSTSFLRTGGTQGLVSIANFRDWRERSTSFEAMATYRGGEYPVTPGTRAEYGQVSIVDAELFRVFAVEPVIGRAFTPEDMIPGNRAIVISYAYWQSHFDGDASVLGRTIRSGADPWPIVGVLPPGFQYPGETDFWVPERTRSTSRTGHNFFAIARLKPRVSLEQAQSELTAIAAGLEQQYPESNRDRGVVATRLQDQLVGDVGLTLYLLWGVVSVVLLIACANTATLLLARATTRTREIGVRTALGASRRRVIRLLITESLLLALLAGACGLLLAYWGVQAFVALAPADVVRHADIGIDGAVLAFTLGVSLATSVLFGLVPALRASKVDLTDTFKERGVHAGMAGRMVRTRAVLVVSEIALAVVLLIGAGLLTKSLLALNDVELGFRPENVLVMKATGPPSFFSEILPRIAALPGVIAVGATSTPPGNLSTSGSGYYHVDRMPEQPDLASEPHTLLTIVAPGAFAALGIPLKRGRDFDENDTADRPLVAIVNEAVVRESFAGENPIGRTIFCPFDRDDGMTIVGVVGDVRQRNPAIAPGPECYMPYTQHDYNASTLHVVTRTAGDPTPFAATVRRLAAEISPYVAVSFTTMDAMVSTRLEDPRFRALLFGLFAGLAVCLAMVGVYGVMAYAVEQRSQEIGLRMALGASSGSVLRLILRQGMVLAAAGLALGLTGAVAATRLLSTLLFEVQPVDTQVHLGVVVLLGVMALVAGYLPARRAAVVDPMVAVRVE